jgi:predicted CXXCH cytochrome family protein
MTKRNGLPDKKTRLKRSFPWILVFGIVLVALLLPAGGFAFAAIQESKDPFCGSCHSQPETTYVERSTPAKPVDLASYHTPKNTRCIDCHSGQGIGGRLSAEMLGANNAIKWYSGNAIQPAPLTQPISDGNCLKCHDQVTQRGYVPKNNSLNNLGEGRNDHWHLFLTRWQSQDSNAATCVSCHGGHTTDGDAQILYLNDQHTTALCESCHQVLGQD